MLLYLWCPCYWPKPRAVLAPKPSGKEPSPRMVLMAPRYELNQPSNESYSVFSQLFGCSLNAFFYFPFGCVELRHVEVYVQMHMLEAATVWQQNQLQLFVSRTSWWRRSRAPSCGCFRRFIWTRPVPGNRKLCYSKYTCSLCLTGIIRASFFSPNVSILRTLLYLILAALTQLRNFDEQDNVPNTIVGAAHGHVHEPLRTYGLQCSGKIGRLK